PAPPRAPPPPIPIPESAHPSTGEPAASLEPPGAPAAAPVQGPVRRFEFVEGGSRKFWEIAVGPISFTVRFGRLGTQGQQQTKSYYEERKTRHEADKLIAEKLKKGYREVSV